jgi:PAS domain S-box-containing protein
VRLHRRIALSFVLLSFLTAATGAVGLLFIYRVVGSFGDVPGMGAAGGVADLDRSMKEAVEISQAIAGNEQVADVLAQRREFVRTVEEFDRSFARIRRGIEDEMSLDRLEQVKSEQSLLAEQTHALVDAMVAELTAEDLYRRALSASEARWQRIVDALAAAMAPLEVTGQSPPALVGPLRSLARAQLELIQTRLDLRRYLLLSDPQLLPPAEDRIGRLIERVRGSAAELRGQTGPETAAPRLVACAQAMLQWLDGLSGETGLLRRYRDALDLEQVTDAYSDAIQEKARESLRSLDAVVALGARMAAQSGERGFVSAAPTLLVAAVVLATLVSITLSIALSSAITRPVKQLIGVAEAVRSGDYTPRLPPGGGDELSTLRETFNGMVQEIQRSHAEVTTLNTGLEERIRERTEELRAEIGRRQTVEDALRQSEARYRTLIRNFPSGVFALVDRELRVLAVGGSGLARLGTTPQQVLGRTAGELLPAHLLETLRARIDAAFAGERQQYQASGGGLDWSVLLVPTTPTGPGAQDTVTVLALDVTETREAEREALRQRQQLVEADRLASLGALAAGVGHEINNPNQAVMLGGELLRKAWPDIRGILDQYRARGEGFLVGGMDYDDVRQGLEEQLNGIVESARRVDAIVRSLREFAAHDRENMKQPVNINVVLRSALVLLGNLLRKTTDHLVVELAPDVPVFTGNPQRVEQVVINLVQNACQALTGRGQEIAIRTSSVDGHVVLEVHDWGAGIPTSDLPRVRDPFFTTKRNQGGTGLGLSVTSTIVAEHRGVLEIHSDPQQGTTVRARFPVRASGDRL